MLVASQRSSRPGHTIEIGSPTLGTVISNGCGESTVGASVAVEFAAFEFATRSLIRPAITHTHFEFEIAHIDGSEKFHGARRGGLVSQ